MCEDLLFSFNVWHYINVISFDFGSVMSIFTILFMYLFIFTLYRFQWITQTVIMKKVMVSCSTIWKKGIKPMLKNNIYIYIYIKKAIVLLWKEASRLWPPLSHVALQWSNASPFHYKRWVSRSKPAQHLPQIYPWVGWECCDLGKTSHPQEWLFHHCRHPIWTTHTYTHTHTCGEWEWSARSVLAWLKEDATLACGDQMALQLLQSTQECETPTTALYLSSECV